MTQEAPPGALAGVKVVEVGQLIAGPFCCQLLGDMGADVVKIEPPGAGDPMRLWGRSDGDGTHLTWPVIARNKRSVTVDLRQGDGQHIARELLREADILVENFRPGTLERWGLGPDELWQANPGLIIVRVTGYGQSGPYATRAGYGSIGEAMGGLRYLTGEPGGAPSRVGVSIGDSLAGTFAALGALAALRARERTGRGQIVDSAIYESVLAFMESAVTEWDEIAFQRERSGSILPGVAPSNVYPTADGQDILIAANQDTVFKRLAGAMGMAGEVFEGFGTHGARGGRQEELDELIAKWTVTQNATDLLALLHEQGVPAGRVYRAVDMFDDPHFTAREAIVRASDGHGRSFAMQNVAPKLSGTPGRVRWSGPRLGEHTDEVLQLLGFDADAIERLRQSGAI
ncbi:MAG TPA: CaiB/BaiF CoA-transferase family protein [Pseudonocardiaceae bacterium]|jgi:formyl-CoA transferase|nr:CaiB/BaiF CoA-transferase family protein [Pseudonocardiaceae bacterium]